MKKIKVMSFNMRTQVEADGVNQFRSRKDRILDMLTREDPDVIGFQEVTDEMRAWTREALGSKYTVVGCGRSKDYRGEATCIAFKRDSFELINLETRWLSATPLVPGSRYAADQSGCPRIYTAATLKHNDSEEIFMFLNTHLDHKGSEARKLGALDVVRYLSEQKLPVIITGDMNAYPESMAIQNAKEKLVDLTEHTGGTYHAFGTAEEKIDYIFADAQTAKKPWQCARLERTEHGIYLSDHYPVMAEGEI